MTGDIVPLHGRWETKPLKRSATFIEGPGVMADEFRNEGIPLIRISGLGGRKVSLEGCNFVSSDIGEKRWGHLRVKRGDLLISGSASTGLCAEVEDEAAGAIPYTGIIIVRPVEGESVKEFLRWFFLSNEFATQVEIFKSGSGIQHFGPTHLAQMRIVLPPIAVQQLIGVFLDRELDRQDAFLAIKRRLLSLIWEKRRAMIAHAVTRGLDPNVPLRDSGVPWLGQIPAHWQTERCAWLFRDRDERGEPELPLLEVSINSGVALRQFSSDQIESTAADFNTYKVARQGDLVFNKMRMWQGAVGIAPVDGLVSPDYTVAEVSPRLSRGFVSYLMRTDQFSAECARESHGITWDRLRLYWEGFREIRIPVPPIDEQQRIVAWIDENAGRAENLRALTAKTIDLLKERRAALISAAVTGQLDLRGTIAS